MIDVGWLIKRQHSNVIRWHGQDKQCRLPYVSTGYQKEILSLTWFKLLLEHQEENTKWFLRGMKNYNQFLVIRLKCTERAWKLNWPIFNLQSISIQATAAKDN